jgi:hypothetical protein
LYNSRFLGEKPAMFLIAAISLSSLLFFFLSKFQTKHSGISDGYMAKPYT